MNRARSILDGPSTFHNGLQTSPLVEIPIELSNRSLAGAFPICIQRTVGQVSRAHWKTQIAPPPELN